MRWAVRSVMPTRSAMSRVRISGSLARQSRTAAWFVTKVQLPVRKDVLDITKRKSYVPRSYLEEETHSHQRGIRDSEERAGEVQQDEVDRRLPRGDRIPDRGHRNVDLDREQPACGAGDRRFLQLDRRLSRRQLQVPAVRSVRRPERILDREAPPPVRTPA